VLRAHGQRSNAQELAKIDEVKPQSVSTPEGVICLPGTFVTRSSPSKPMPKTAHAAFERANHHKLHDVELPTEATNERGNKSASPRTAQANNDCPIDETGWLCSARWPGSCGPTRPAFGIQRSSECFDFNEGRFPCPAARIKRAGCLP
jgi:hypothetical protein